LKLRIADDVSAWPTDLRTRDPEAARLAGEAMIALVEGGAGAGAPLVAEVEPALLAHDPIGALDHAYRYRLALLAKVRRAVADIATSAKRIELQIDQLDAQVSRLGQQIQGASEAGREHVADAARARRTGMEEQLTDLRQAHADVRRQREEAGLAGRRLQAKVDEFRSGKEIIKAAYAAGQARTAIEQALARIGEDSEADPPAVDEAIAAARSAAERQLGNRPDATGPAEDPVLHEVRLAALTGRDIRVLVVIDPAGTVTVLAAQDGHDQWTDWYRQALPLARALLAEMALETAETGPPRRGDRAAAVS
jgi:phage shock protein A